MTIQLATLVEEWDADYDSHLTVGVSPDRRSPYAGMLMKLLDIAPLRFQPYQNDDILRYEEKLPRWLEQFPGKADKRAAFLLATRIAFVTVRQMEALQAHLFETGIRRHLLERIISNKGLHRFDYVGAAPFLNAEMDRTIFVQNSDSSLLNSFSHVNKEYFADRGRRRLLGPEVEFWTYPASRAAENKVSARVRTIAQLFEKDVLGTDSRVQGKRRIVILEDFSGAGSDLLDTTSKFAHVGLPFDEVIIAPLIATQEAIEKLRKLTSRLNKIAKGRSFYVIPGMQLPNSLRCFGAPKDTSYLDGSFPIKGLSREIERISDRLHISHFNDLHKDHRHGFGNLALAFAHYFNCPDNSLPLIWKNQKNWVALFPRASRYI